MDRASSCFNPLEPRVPPADHARSLCCVWLRSLYLPLWSVILVFTVSLSDDASKQPATPYLGSHLESLYDCLHRTSLQSRLSPESFQAIDCFGSSLDGRRFGRLWLGRLRLGRLRLGGLDGVLDVWDGLRSRSTLRSGQSTHVHLPASYPSFLSAPFPAESGRRIVQTISHSHLWKLVEVLLGHSFGFSLGLCTACTVLAARAEPKLHKVSVASGPALLVAGASAAS